jgi:hypothetical protein
LGTEAYSHTSFKQTKCRMVSSGLLRRVALVRTDVRTRATRRNNPEDTILHSHRRENLKSYRLSVIVKFKISQSLVR